MKKITIPNNISISLLPITGALGILAMSACAPDPTLQKEMDEDILTAAERGDNVSTTGPQQGRGSQTWGYGGF